jgi:acetyl/propionyl-CoA carboxylase alpha subunit
MHRISNAGDIAGAVQTARREATAAFGDGTLYVERLIEPARHVEVQIFGDGAGRVIHLWERDCSLQRRHQKVIEESPSPAIDEPLRTRMTAAATAAAEAVSYRSAGTVEFLVDLSQSGSETPFYFLEMNTRLQVEHPVTEGVTGVDLVRAQLLVASGGGLPWQTPPPPRGHSIEARIYAEDPARGFLPQSGRVLLYREPRMPGIRIDSGITEGCDVPVHYDPLLSKVIATAETRELAITRLAAALRRYPVLGVPTNIPFLLHLLNHPRFKAGDADTQFVESEGRLKDWLRSSEVPEPVRAAFAAHLSASGTGDVHAPYVGSGFSRTRTTGVIDPWSQK